MNFENCKAYELIEKRMLSDIQSEGYILRHRKTGARISLIQNDDANKVFYIGFRTPSRDSTGVAHIIEHSVLCGSKRFPAKDPFVELVKGSLNTFLNAMTYPDKTIYPIASTNDADFQNLMHVYLDAVFYPNIYSRPEIFWQEGWHYELEQEDEPITLNGVVYNEMKGAFSSPEGVLDRQILNALYPDTSYQYESGGDPEEIPNLTYEGFLDFHRTYYHPSNSYIYLYGNMDMEEKLNWIDAEYLGKFEYLKIDSNIRLQEPFAEKKEVVKYYSLASSEEVEDNTYLSCNYSIDTVMNKELYLAFDILDYALLGAPGAPLKKALLDAKIGKDIMSSYDNSIYQPIFSIVAKNSNPEKKKEFLDIIDGVVTDLVKNGLNKKSLLAGINSFEFRYRESDFGHYPKGLLFGIQCLDSWLYEDSQPFVHMDVLEVIEWLKQQVETDYFERLMEQYLLNNPHKAVVIVEPKHGLNTEKEKELEERLQKYKESLTESEIQNLVEMTLHLKEYQDEPSTKEELESIPLLTREDLKREAEPFSLEETVQENTKVLFHEVESNGIAYLTLLFDTAGVAKEDLPYLGILKAVLGYMDTENYNYSELANEIDLHTGGISSSNGVYAHVSDESYMGKFEVRIKTLYGKMEKALALTGEMIATTKLVDEQRLYEIIAQLKSRLQMSLSSSGHSVSAMRAMSYFSSSAKYSDLTGGIDLYQVVRQIEENFDSKKKNLVEKLQNLIEVVFRPENLMVSVGSQKEGYDSFVSILPEFKKHLWTTQITKHQDVLVCQKKNEGFLDASQVQYVSRAGNFKKAGYAYTGVLRTLKVILSYEYLWLNIRVKGGAYGCMAGFTRRGDGYFSSYRDPNLEKTNQVYEDMVEYLRNFEIEERDMTKYVIGTFSDLDTPLTPSIQVNRSLNAYLTGVTLADVQKERDEILAATTEDIRALSGIVEAVLKEEAICVIGNEDKLKEQAQLFMELKSLH